MLNLTDLGATTLGAALMRLRKSQSGAANPGCSRLLAGSLRPRTPWFPSQETLPPDRPSLVGMRDLTISDARDPPPASVRKRLSRNTAARPFSEAMQAHPSAILLYAREQADHCTPHDTPPPPARRPIFFFLRNPLHRTGTLWYSEQVASRGS